MSFGGEMSEPVASFKSFISEGQIEEKRKLRQAEWEKVRKEDDPVEAPEPEFDGRSLYDRLQEQKQKKDDEYEEKHRLSNQVQGIDEGEAEFLDFVSQRRSELTKARDDENEAVLQEYREAVVNLNAEATSKSDKKPMPKPQASSKSKSQLTLLAGAVKRKSTDSSTDTDTKMAKTDIDESGAAGNDCEEATVPSGIDPKLARVVAVLPGLGAYSNSSNSETSDSDSDVEHGQTKLRILKPCQHHGHSH